MENKLIFSLQEIVDQLGGTLKGDASITISQVSSLASAKKGQIAFFVDPKLKQQLLETEASALIISPKFSGETNLPCIICPNVYAYYARLAQLFNPPTVLASGVHPSAVVNSEIPSSAKIGAQVVIGKNVVLGNNVTISAGCIIGDGVSIGENSLLHPNTVIYQNCVIGQRNIIHACTVIGSDGFGYAKEEDCWIKIPQIGRVVIGNDVEIGANTSIDRGALDDTIIKDGVKLDNQIHIAHNVHIGENTAIAACVGIAGSAKIGRRCTIGGAGMIVGHIELGDDVHVSGGTVITKSLLHPGQYTGIFPFA